MTPATSPAAHHDRRQLSTTVAGAAALGSLLVTSLVLGPPAAAGRPASTLGLQPLGSYSNGGFDESAAEIPAFDPGTDRVFVVNAEAGTVDVLDVSDPTEPIRIDQLRTPGANSVDVSDGVLAVAEAADPAQAPGSVAFFDTATLEPLGAVTVGALPDMLTYTPDGQTLLVANEGEPAGYEPGDLDPDGTVSVIDVRGGVPSQDDVRTARFDGFTADGLRAAGVRVFGPGASVAQDIEPEYVAVDRTSRTAWVSLQENNALAVVDIRTATVTDILPLGLKDHSVPANGLDPSDRDGQVAIGTWPVRGMYMPDAIDTYAHRGQTYVVTANEGDARDYDGFAEEARVAEVELSPDAFGGADAVAALQEQSALGRLTVTTAGAPTDEQGRLTQIHAFGARSFSIRSADGTLVYDSGDDFERITSDLLPADFNADNAENDSFDNRSDNKGPEPEGVEIGQVAGRTYAFIGLERVGGIMVYDVTTPSEATFVEYVSTRDFAGDLAENGSDSGPEGLVFVTAEDSPTGSPLLVVGNEVSGTTTLFEVTGR